jgi:hypothetical protein
MKKHLHFDPETGLLNTFHLDQQTGEARVDTTQDVTACLDVNKELQTESVDRRANWRRVAQIPLTLWFDLRKRGILQDKKKLKAWLNDSENRFFRTNSERV